MEVNKAMLFMVIRFSDDLPEDAYGIDNKYTLIGAFTDRVVAEGIRDSCIAQKPDYEEVTILEVETDKEYSRQEEPFLGGGSYRE